MRMAVRVGLALALAGASGWARAQEPDATHEAQAEREQERTQREAERAEREQEREEREQERASAMDERYEHGTELVDEGHWDQAVPIFDQIVREKGRRADASLYWKAYALQKLGREADALETLNQLRSAHPKSSWVKQAKVLELEIRQGGGSAPPPVALASLLHIGCRAADLVQLLGKQLPPDAKQGPALEDSKACDAQRRILASRRLDQAVQFRLVEQLGPEAQVGLGLLLGLPDLAVQIGMPVVEPGDALW